MKSSEWRSGGLDGTIKTGNRIVARFAKTADRNAVLEALSTLKLIIDCVEATEGSTNTEQIERARTFVRAINFPGATNDPQ